MIPYTIVQCKVLRKKYNKTKINTCCAKNLFFNNLKTQKEQKILLALFSALCFKLTIVHYRIKISVIFKLFLSLCIRYLFSFSLFFCLLNHSLYIFRQFQCYFSKLSASEFIKYNFSCSAVICSTAF